MKTVVMTGGTAGFGAVAAKRIFNTPNTKLILGARDNKNSSIETLPLDLARLSNVRSFVQSLERKLNGTKIDILIMNAGAQFGNTRHRTGDGFESTFAINHLAHYLLLQAAGAQSREERHHSHHHKRCPRSQDGSIRTEGTRSRGTGSSQNTGKGFIPGIRAYASSKLCDLLTARAFEASTDAQMNGMRVIAYNPGLTPGTSLFRAWPWWAKLAMGVASYTSSSHGHEHDRAGRKCNCRSGLGTIVPPLVAYTPHW